MHGYIYICHLLWFVLPAMKGEMYGGLDFYFTVVRLVGLLLFIGHIKYTFQYRYTHILIYTFRE